MLKKILIICIISLLSNAFSQNNKMSYIDNLLSNSDLQIKQNDLIEINLDFNSNGFPVDSIPPVISFWENPYIKDSLSKISFREASPIFENTIEFYYFENKCYYIYEKVTRYNEESVTLIYLINGEIIQITISNSVDGKISNQNMYINNFKEINNYENSISSLINLSSKYIVYFYELKKIPIKSN